jgi:hypothetical protein
MFTAGFVAATNRLVVAGPSFSITVIGSLCRLLWRWHASHTTYGRDQIFQYQMRI